MLKYEIYENQSETADKIINSINLGHKRIHVVAPTQSGKTGVIISLANKLKDSNFILTSGMMENHLYEQNGHIAENAAMNIKAMKVNKLLKLPNPKEVISDLNIKYIVVDENHYGIGKTSRLDKLLKKLLSSNLDITIIWVGATGYQLIESDLIDDTIQMNVPSTYFGCKQILKLPMLKDSKDFKFTIDADSKDRKKANIDFGFSLSKDFTNQLNYLKSFKTGLGIIRVRTKSKAENIKTAISNASPYFNTIIATSGKDESIADNIRKAKMLSNHRRVVLIVVGGLKAGVDLGFAKENVRFVIETYKTKAAVSQGLVGRISGYHPNRKISIVADIVSIELQAAYETDFRIVNEDFLNDMFEGGNHTLATNFKFGKQKLRRKKTYFGQNYKVKDIKDLKTEWFKGYNSDYSQKVKELMVNIRNNQENGYSVTAKDYPSADDKINTIQEQKFNNGGFDSYIRRLEGSKVDFNIFHRFAGTSEGKRRNNKDYAKEIKVGILYNKKDDSFNIVVRNKKQTELIASTKINNKSIFNNLNL